MLLIAGVQGRLREASIPKEMQRLQIREEYEKKEKKEKKKKKRGRNRKEERERRKELTYPGNASGILHTPPRRLHTHIHMHPPQRYRRTPCCR